PMIPVVSGCAMAVQPSPAGERRCGRFSTHFRARPPKHPQQKVRHALSLTGGRAYQRLMPPSLTLVEPPSGSAPILPHDVEAEAALLGALMIDNRLYEDVQMKLQPGHFYEPLHGRRFEQIDKLIQKNRLATPVTLRPLFETDEEMKALGG